MDREYRAAGSFASHSPYPCVAPPGKRANAQKATQDKKTEDCGEEAGPWAGYHRLVKPIPG
jgi:hypothetical protein